jgi:hypothetical protein
MKHKIVEPPISEMDKALREANDTIVAHLEEMNKAGTATFADWLACQQALMQIHQIQSLQQIADVLRSWKYYGVPVYAMAM